MLVAVILLIWSFYNKQSYIFAGLVAGGAVGNALDRLRLGAVVDFIDIYWQNLHWPAFNFADIYISPLWRQSVALSFFHSLVLMLFLILLAQDK